MTPEKPPSHHSAPRPTFSAPPAAIAAALGALLLCVPVAGDCQVYRWVDGGGVTHFSQTPPPTGSYRELQAPPPPAEDPAKARAKIDKINRHFQDEQRARRQQAQAAGQRQQVRQQRAQLCQRFKQRLTALTIRPHILVTSHDGQVRRMTEPQRQTQIKEAKTQIAKDCGQ